MKRIMFTGLLALLLVTPQFLTNCSQRLESVQGNDPVDPLPPGTIIDTVTIVDTIEIVQGGSTDTVLVFDTTVHIDTVIVVTPGSTGSLFVCDQLSSGQKHIVWMFRNAAGPFLLEFVGYAERFHPTQEFAMYVGGEEYFWRPAESAEFTLQSDLEQNAMIRIVPTNPNASGHAVDICLTLTAM